MASAKEHAKWLKKMHDELAAKKAKDTAIENPVGVRGLPQITTLS